MQVSREFSTLRLPDEPLENRDTVAAADVVCDLSSEALVVHKQKIQLPDVADQELLEAVGQEVTGLRGGGLGEQTTFPICAETCLLVASVTNLLCGKWLVRFKQSGHADAPWAWEAGP